jgi:hypothetical protein
VDVVVRSSLLKSIIRTLLRDSVKTCLQILRWGGTQGGSAARPAATCLHPCLGLRSDRGGVPSYACRKTHTAGVCPQPAHLNARKIESYVEGVWRSQMAGEAFLVKRDSAALQNASEALTEAEEELASFAADLTARRTLELGYHAALEARAEAVEGARVDLRRGGQCK